MTLAKLAALLGSLVLLLAVAAWTPAEPALVNIAPATFGTRVVADTSYDAQHSGANAVDGRIAPGDASWYSRDQTQLPCGLTFEFGAREQVRRVVLHQAQWQGSMYHTKDFAIEASDDGKAWQRITTGQLEDRNDSHIALEARADTRWLRVVVLTSYIPFQTCGFAEVEILAQRPVSVGAPRVTLGGASATVSDDVCGLSLLHRSSGPQVAVYRRQGALLAALAAGEEAAIELPVTCNAANATLTAEAELVGPGQARAIARAGGATREVALSQPGKRVTVSVPVAEGSSSAALRLAGASVCAVRLSNVALRAGELTVPIQLQVTPTDYGAGAPPVTPALRPAIEQALIEWDWRAQDGIDTERQPVLVEDAVKRIVKRGVALARDAEKAAGGAPSPALRKALAAWSAVVQDEFNLATRKSIDPEAWDALYTRAHQVKRALMLAHPLANVGPVLFAKQVPGCFSHQLTQYYGRYARPGGGIFVLERPGASMAARQLTPKTMASGSYMFPEVSWNADRVLFAYCATDSMPENRIQGTPGRFYHLYSIKPDGTGLKSLTDGPYNDFAARFLPNGQIVFISTRRGGWHRCGTPGCENYVLTVANADGTRAHPISFHETQEWDPTVLNDGRIAYTRWDYVDRHPVFYEHLWTTGPDGTRAAAFFGNNTFNPVGVWEARAIPGSTRVMATAAAHHAMTTGSIILVDQSRGVDGPLPIERLTPDAPFPESETTVSGIWHNPMPGVEAYDTEENQRWPGASYRSPYPLSERLFLAAYSFRQLVGEPTGNAANMFGLYLCDAFGNKELLYRDPNIASLWPMPLRSRKVPPALPSNLDPKLADEGEFVIQDVYSSMPQIARGTVKSLRVVQVLPKSTPGKDMPAIGVASGAPGKQVLGTVPVEPDGSAYLRAPARKELAFQALDERGMAVQIMRSGTYLQPGEKATCVGCHERRTTSPPARQVLALRRAPSRIAPGPDGSRPLSYPILVQTVLDQKCVSCHSGPKPAANLALTGEPEGHYTRSYNALVGRVPFSDMNNGEALSKPGRFGSHGSPLMSLLLADHAGVKLTRDEIGRIATWMDVSALFYGTFDVKDQEKQQRGQRIAGVKLE